MYRADFVGRSRELEVFNNLWSSARASLIILYGRRRVGKTRLLTHWLESQREDGLYWVAEPTSALTQLRSFSQALMNFMDPETPLPPDFTFSTWELAFRQLALFSQKRRIAIFMDEVTYLIDVNPDFVGTLQKAWDQWLSSANLMLVMSGSQMGLMRKHLLDYDAPLHGRATAQIKLPPLPFGATKDYFPDYNAEDRIKIYAMWGGVPAYWERLDENKPILENLRQHILPSHAWMVDESRILLQDFITDLHNYVGIMRAIADGEQAINEIANRIGLSSSKASFYLSVLRDTGFVERRAPISQRGTDSRRGRYYVTDPYLRFFYRFLSSSQAKLALGHIKPVVDTIEEELSAFIQASTWQEICSEWVLRASSQGKIPLVLDEMGSEWTGNSTIDIVGISDSEQNLVIGDCYWTNSPIDEKAIDRLLKKTQMIPAPNGKWSVYYVLFSSHGWTPEAYARAEEIAAETAQARTRKKLHTAGIRLIDLEEVDKDLAEWSI